MLTPEYLSLIEFNDVVRLYNQLNIDITADAFLVLIICKTPE